MEEIIKNQIIIFKQVYETILKQAQYPEATPYVNLETARCIYKQVNKDLRVKQQMKEEKEEPSEKQINYAKKLGIEKPETYNRKELSKKIEEKLI